MAYTILGYNGVTEIGRRTVEEPRGVSTEVHYEGPKPTIIAFYESLRGQGYYLDCDVLNPPKGKLIVRTPDLGDGAGGEGIVQTQFDLSANHSQRSLWEHPKTINIFHTDRATFDSMYNDLNGNSPGSLTGLTGDADLFYSAMLLGQDDFFDSQFVFRMTQYFVNGTILDIAYNDVNRVYTNAELIDETNPTALYETAIAEAYESYLETQFGGSVPPNSTLGWLKHAPQIANVAGGRSALTFEFWLNAWSDYHYT